MNTKQKLLIAASSATIALAGFAAIPAQAVPLSEWIGMTEDRLIYVMGPASQVTANPDGTRTLKFIYQQTWASPGESSGEAPSAVKPKRCEADLVIGENRHVKAAKFVGKTCDVKSHM